MQNNLAHWTTTVVNYLACGCLYFRIKFEAVIVYYSFTLNNNNYEKANFPNDSICFNNKYY